MRQAIEKYPDHELLHAALGHGLLIHGEIADAEKSLLKSLTLPLCQHDKRAGVLYNLACACSLSHRPWAAVGALWDASRIQPLDLTHIAKDVDFDSIRRKLVFRCIIQFEKLRQRFWRLLKSARKSVTTKLGSA